MIIIPRQRWRFALIALVIATIACNLPGNGPEVQPTPWIIYVTETPPGGVGERNSQEQPPIGPFYTLAPTSDSEPAPTLDLSNVTLFPTPTESSGQSIETPTPTTATTPTITLMPDTPQPTATPTAIPPTPTPQPPADASYTPLLGINFISSAQHPADKERIDLGKNAGAEWDRFAIYWSDVESTIDTYKWGLYDRTVDIDVRNNLQTNAILLGAPKFAADVRGIPLDLDEPVFADGTDKPGPSKQINPDNAWAEFVFTAVARYRPGGVLAREKKWKEGQGIRLWEIWNEPDFSLFWPGTVQEYARLLKVAYIAAQHADPHAQVMVGGLVLFEERYWFNELLTVYRNDPNPVDQRYPFNAVAVHSYSHPAHTFYAIERIENFLTLYGLGETPIWLNESGVAVWDDYPGPTWAVRDDQKVWRATQSEQADYMIQSAAFAVMAEAHAIYHFQLYDDCGNQPAGTTFAPHSGELCSSLAVCWGDAFGLMRNSSDNTCFNQHPNANTPRPAYTAYQVVDRVFTRQPLVPLTGFLTGGGTYYRMLFARPSTGQVITVLWNETGSPLEVDMRAYSEDGASLIYPDNNTAKITPDEEGLYHITLAPATNRNQNNVPFMIGGPPVIVIEDSTRPIVSVLPLIDDSLPAFLVKWRTSDPSISQFEIWYRDDRGNGEWVRWIETNKPGEALFVGTTGHRYSFFARGLSGDGEWTQDAPSVQAWTRVE